MAVATPVIAEAGAPLRMRAADDAAPDTELAFLRTIHETVVQRLCGVSLVLGASEYLGSEQRRVCSIEVAAALEELRCALLTRASAVPTEPSLEGELLLLRQEHPGVRIRLTGARRLSAVAKEPRGLISSVLREGLRNTRKHANPTDVHITARQHEGARVVTITNDGRREAAEAPGVGLRLLAMEITLHGGSLRSGPDGDSGWKLQASLPTAI